MTDNDTKKEVKEEKKQAPKTTGSVNTGKIMEQIEKLTVLELADLVKALEEKFGVSATPMAMATAGATSTGAKPEGEEQASGQTTFNVVLTNSGTNKISVIKMVREINQTLGLKEAKDLVESAPKEVIAGANKQTAEEAKKKLESAGATVELK